MHAACERLGVEVCLAQEDLTQAPRCPHGPMLLFERFFKDGRQSRKFYACSACRDRKTCSFFQWQDEKVSEIRTKVHEEIVAASRPSFTSKEFSKRLEQLHSSSNAESLFCHSCNLLLLPDEKYRHKDHDTVLLSASEMRKPSYIFKPLENQKFHAQYLFSMKATEFVIKQLNKLKFNRVLCIGTPRIHEAIQLMRAKQLGEDEAQMDSLLLDIDHRYAQFFKPSKFCWYNVFNHHFFDCASSEKRFRKFLHAQNGEGIAILMDPPFGGLVDVLGNTIKRIWQEWRAAKQGIKTMELPTIWVFPYFLETHITASIPSLVMLDYKVDYDNHPHFTSKRKEGIKRGSPVRIFTNISAAEFVLPKDEGYRFCDACQRYVSSENVHCAQCNSCTSKDGRRYVHCNICEKCVKPDEAKELMAWFPDEKKMVNPIVRRTHCLTCGICEPPEHDCNRKHVQGCHICGALDHKRRHCPNRGGNPISNGNHSSKRRSDVKHGSKIEQAKNATRSTKRRKAFNRRAARKRMKKS